MKRSQTIGIRIDNNLNRQLECLAREKDKTKSEIVYKILLEYFQKDKHNISRKRDKVLIERLIRLELYCRKNFEVNADVTEEEKKEIKSAAEHALRQIY